MSSIEDKDSIEIYLSILKRLPLDGVDIVTKGEKPKSEHYLLVKDIKLIIELMKTKTDKEVIAFIAKKLRKV